MKNTKTQHRIMRHQRVRAKIKGIAKRPRVSVFKSNQHIFAQVIDDIAGKTILSSSDVSVGAPTKASGQKSKSKMKGTKTELAGKIGEILAEKIKTAGLSKIIFDRGGFKYHGRVKALAEGLRKGGIKF